MYNYIGGKHKTGKWIYNNFPLKKWSNYTEVFGGAMWVYLQNDISADRIYFNDINPFLTNIWNCMKEPYRDDFIDILSNTSVEMLDSRDLFHSFKAFYDIIMDRKDFSVFNNPSLALAHMMIYILTHCWSGNITRQGCGNPKSKAIMKWNTFINRLSDKRFQEKIDKVDVLNLDFGSVIQYVDDINGCLYVDPPYWNLEEEYYTQFFPKEKHFELADMLKECMSFWILSYYEYEDLEEIYPKKDFYWRKKLVTKTAPHLNKSKEYELIIFPREKYDEIINSMVGRFF